ncbi:TldD/PmbA family protein [Paracoccus shanxieyensis]|uniref:TldD/PmbA family protein n=1 Tax=Paracoccus shanxieyensis TaxID=2675752 RepID=A0A6L6IZU6_9RHOB|nr:metallopeptidase TldD-related protein [Paracoccus shanxieyensis]MTH65803.1 TldD/PmbA family protein [Paracoccus shanxieyensis]MTH89155.1 TldD/PmbA family protein [Paracoccus shanxieyensis]
MSDVARLQSLTDQLLTAARRAGADQADAVALDAAAVSVDVRGGRLEHAERAEGVEIGLRVLLGGRQACVSGSDPGAIDDMAARAVAMAREAPVDDHLGLAEPGQLTQDTDSSRLDLFDASPEPTPEDLQDAALRAEAAALAVPGVSQVETASAGHMRRWMWLQGTNGLSAGYARSAHSLSAVAITGTGTGMERDWAGEGRVHRADMPSAESIGQLAGERTVARSGAKKPPTGAFPILYDERVAAGLIGHLVGAVNGRAVARGASWLRDAMGQAVLPAGFDLIELPHLPRYGNSRLFDAEGLATAERALVRDGILQGWTLDLATGRKLGMASTANASRGTSSPPSPGVTNLALGQGSASRDDLIRDMGRGLIVTSMLGSSINATTGDYSRGASGFWVENGQITHAVNECTIAGNLRDMLMRITAANDARDWHAMRVPSLLVEGMTVAGA